MQAMSKDTPLASSNNGDCFFFWHYVIVNARTQNVSDSCLISFLTSLSAFWTYSLAYAIHR